jgi:hypothetical protein
VGAVYISCLLFIMHRCVLCVHSLEWLLEMRKIKKGKLSGAEKTQFDLISFLYRYNQLRCNSVYYRDTEPTMKLAYKSHSCQSGEKLNFAHYLHILFRDNQIYLSSSPWHKRVNIL